MKHSGLKNIAIGIQPLPRYVNFSHGVEKRGWEQHKDRPRNGITKNLLIELHKTQTCGDISSLQQGAKKVRLSVAVATSQLQGLLWADTFKTSIEPERYLVADEVVQGDATFDFIPERLRLLQ